MPDKVPYMTDRFRDGQVHPDPQEHLAAPQKGNHVPPMTERFREAEQQRSDAQESLGSEQEEREGIALISANHDGQEAFDDDIDTGSDEDFYDAGEAFADGYDDGHGEGGSDSGF